MEAARKTTIEPELLTGVHGNLGVTYYFQGELDLAIEHYRRALETAEAAGLDGHRVGAHYNLAEAHFRRFARDRRSSDEVQGDQHAALATRLAAAGNQANMAEAARGLKREVLGERAQPDRLIPEEFAAHFDEMAEIQRLRLSLAVPQDAARQVRTRLAIARAYLSIATQEREAALALAAKHALPDDFADDLTRLRGTFERALTREERATSAWQREAADLLEEAARQQVLARLFEAGSISKSLYAELADVALATASKHLGMLASRGLLMQTGKGPATRYLLPET